MTDIDNGGGPQTPLVSVIVRTTGRPELDEALQSIAAQHYRPLEIVLVDAAGTGTLKDTLDAWPTGTDVPIHPVSNGSPLPRPLAANLGLEASHGEYLLFLDEDDWIAPEHIGNLVAALGANPAVQAAYSSTRKADPQGNLLDEVFEHEFDATLLRLDNYIPIHAMLFSRRLLQDGCRFDESLAIYEDWDFWLQLAQQTDFLHIDEMTAFYRQGGGSETDNINHEAKFRHGQLLAEARTKLYGKWKARWTAEQVNELIGATVSRSEFNAAATELSRVALELNEKKQKVQEMDSYAASLRALLDKSTRESAALARESEELRKTLQRVKRQHALSDLHRDRHIKELESRLNAIYTLPSWRLMGPFRRAKRLLDAVLLFPLKKRLHFWRYGTELIIPALEGDTQLPLDEENHSPQLEADTKSRYRQAAELNLQRFLQSDNTLAIPPSEQPLVSILLVLYNQAPLTLLCIESILKFAPAPYELVIVNNASADETDRLLSKLTNVTVINNADNEGFVRAVNQGVEHCRGRYLLLLNNDAMLHLYSIESAIETLQRTPDAGAVGGRILLLDGSLQEAGSIIFDDGGCLGYGRHGIADAPEFMFSRPVDYCSGAFLLCETALFRSMDGFDLDYAPAYYEDSDFCIRLQERGLKVIYDPNAVITHYEFASSGGQEKAGQLQEKHRQVLQAKHPQYLARRHPVAAEPALFSRTANNQPNVLVIDDRVPHASLGSGYPRCREILSLLASSGFNVTLYPLQFPEESWRETYDTLPDTIEVMLDLGLQRLSEFLQKRRGFYSTVIVSRIHNMQVVNEVLAAQPDLFDGARLIYDAEAITAPREILQRELQGETVPERERFDLVEQEISAARTADRIVAVSDQEAAIYGQHGFNNTVVLGHSLHPVPGEKNFTQRAGLLFVGALRDEDSPNVDSLHWFISHVWPLIRAAEPAVILHVVGDNEAPSLQALDATGVCFHGRLGDINELYNSARVFIAPTRFAAGIPHKVHEAAAHGVPSVTTSLLASQLGWENRKQLLTADSPQDFAERCIELLGDESLWNKIRRNGLAAVASDCSPARFRAVLLELLELLEPAQNKAASKEE
ncbi:MAG: glycosyltransferase [Gammaproteobacteria bacterium]